MAELSDLFRVLGQQQQLFIEVLRSRLVVVKLQGV
jgi:hypothetical protein